LLGILVTALPHLILRNRLRVRVKRIRAVPVLFLGLPIVVHIAIIPAPCQPSNSLPPRFSQTHLHGIDAGARKRLVLVEEEIRKPRPRQARREPLQRRAVRLVGRERVRLEEHAAVVPRGAYHAVEGAAAVGRVCCYQRERRQRLFGGLDSGHVVRGDGVGTDRDEIVGCACDAGGGLAGESERRAA
jgi:hypothetical protein